MIYHYDVVFHANIIVHRDILMLFLLDKIQGYNYYLFSKEEQITYYDHFCPYLFNNAVLFV